MSYDFDTILDRKGTNSAKWDKYQNTDVLPFWVADMDFAVAPEIVAALRTRLEHPVFGYTRTPDGLVDGLIAYLKKIYGWDIHADWIVWLPGVVTGLATSCNAYLKPGDQAMINPPIYEHFFCAHNDNENELIQVPLCKKGDRWTYDIPAMEAAMTAKTRLLLLCSPHNPTGTVFTRDELITVCEVAQKYDAVVVSDEIHCGLVLNRDTPHLPTALATDYSDSIVTLMSQSKTWNLAGMNCSCAIISNPVLRKQFEAARAEVVPHVTTMAYVSAEAAFNYGEPWRLALLEYLRGNYDFIRDELDQISGLELQRSDATYLAWIDATELKLDSAEMYFEKYGIGMCAGEKYGQSGFLRLNFACSRKMLEEGIHRIKAGVNALRRI